MLFRDMEGHVRHVMRHVKEKRAFFVLFDELHRVLGVPRGELRLIWHHLYDLLVFIKGQGRKVGAPSRMVGPHVVRIRQAEVIIEALPGRKPLGGVAQVPLSVDGRGIPALL